MLQTLRQAFVADQARDFGSQQSRYIRCTQGSAEFSLRAYKGSTLVIDAKTFQAGLSIGPTADFFDRVEITNGSTAQTIEVYYGDSDVVDNRLVGNVNITGGIATKTGGDTVASETTVSFSSATTTQIWGLCSNPSLGIIQNIGAADVYLATSAAKAPNGILLPASSGGVPGYIEWPAGLDCYGYAPTGAATLRILQTRWA